MHNSSNKSKGYMPVSSGPNMTGFDMGKTSSLMEMMQTGGQTTAGGAALARALQFQKDQKRLQDAERKEAQRQKKGGLFGSIGGLAGGLLGSAALGALGVATGGLGLPLAAGLGTALGKRAGEGLGAGKSRRVDRTGTVFGQQSFRDIEQASRDYTRGMGERALVSGLQAGLMAGLTPGGGIYGKAKSFGIRNMPSQAFERVAPLATGAEAVSSAPVLGTEEAFQQSLARSNQLGSLNESILPPVLGTEEAFQQSLAKATETGSLNRALDIAQTAESQAMQTSDQMQRLIDYLSGGEQVSFVPFGRNAGLPFGSFEDGGLIGMQTGGLTAEGILRGQGLVADDTQLGLFQAFDPTEIGRARETTGQSLLGMTGGQGLASAGGGFGAQQSAISQMVEQGQKSLEQQIQDEQKAFESQTLATAGDIVAGGGTFGQVYSGATTAQTAGGGTTAISGAPANPDDGDTFQALNGKVYEWDDNAGSWFEVDQG